MPVAGSLPHHFDAADVMIARTMTVSTAWFTVNEQIAKAMQHGPIERVRPIADAGMLAGSTRFWTDGSRNAEDDPSSRTTWQRAPPVPDAREHV